jgi:hypothetical protein
MALLICLAVILATLKVRRLAWTAAVRLYCENPVSRRPVWLAASVLLADLAALVAVLLLGRPAFTTASRVINEQWRMATGGW